MPWTLSHNQALRIVEVLYTGEVTGRELREVTSKCITLEKENGVNRFLCDASDCEISASLLDLFDLPAEQYAAEKADRSGRVAVVLPRSPRARDAAQFYETASRNRGWMVQAFASRQEAVDWLTG